jgi:DNA repair ATPase RecN
MTNTSPTQKILSDKTYFVNSLKNLKDKIESISLFHQTKILSIFYENNIPVNENKNGVFINLTYVDSSILEKVYKYLIYVNKQEEQLNELEEQKQKIATSFFS